MKQYLIDMDKSKKSDGLFTKKLNLFDIDIKSSSAECFIGINLLDKDDEIKEGIIYYDGEGQGMIIYKISRKKIYAKKIMGNGLYTIWVPDMYITFCRETGVYSVTYNKDQLYILPNTFEGSETQSYIYPNEDVANFFKTKKLQGFVRHSNLCLGRGLHNEQYSRSSSNLEDFSTIINQLLSAQGNCDLHLHQYIARDTGRSNNLYHSIFNKYSELSKLMDEDDYLQFSKFYLNLANRAIAERNSLYYYIEGVSSNYEGPIFNIIIDQYIQSHFNKGDR